MNEFLATLPDKKQKAYGKRVREALRELFAVIHRRDKLGDAYFRFIRITQGTRGETDRRWCERIWTTVTVHARTGDWSIFRPARCPFRRTRKPKTWTCPLPWRKGAGQSP